MRTAFSWFRAFIDLSIMVGLIIGSSLSALGFLAFIWPDFDILNQFQLLFLTLTVISAIATFIWPYYFPRLRPYAQALLLVPFLSSITMLLPDVYGSLSAPKLDLERVDKASSRDLRIMTFNIFLQNWDKDGSVAAIAKYNPDIVLLQEFAPNRYKHVQALKKTYPYQARCKHWTICTLGILSKYPLSNIQSRKFATPQARDDIHGRILSATVRVKGFAPLRIHSFHADWPSPLGEQTAHFERLNAYIIKDMKRFPNTVLAGDFNSSSWSLTMRDFTEALPLSRHSYLKPTYPTPNLVVKRYLWLPAFLSLDHIFSSASVPVFNLERGFVKVADHHPLIADLLIFKKSL